MATNFMVEIGTIGLFTFIRNGLQYRHSAYKKLIYDNLATFYVNLVNYGPVTPEFKNGKGVQPLVTWFYRLPYEPSDPLSATLKTSGNEPTLLSTGHLSSLCATSTTTSFLHPKKNTSTFKYCVVIL